MWKSLLCLWQREPWIGSLKQPGIGAMRDALLKERPEGAARLVEAIRHDAVVSGLTHTFYRYPARFSPEFARAAIELFTDAGDVVLDPFMGGGTVGVEAIVSGRQFIGCDVSSLATFISEVKATPLTAAELVELDAWLILTLPQLNIWRPSERPAEWIEKGYQRNIGDKKTWRIRKILEQSVSAVEDLNSWNAQRFARCLILRTGQWALDGRRTVPGVADFRLRLVEFYLDMRKGMEAYVQALASLGLEEGGIEAVFLNRTAVGLDEEEALRSRPPPKLILTSPPYPGVYINYHRWKVRGRKETPAPFWLTSTLDGSGISHYLMGWRQEPGLKSYWRNLSNILAALKKTCGPDTWIVQMVGFADADDHLHRYLQAMDEAGFDEVHLDSTADRGDRIWRDVPGRRWYAAYQASTRSTSQEVVLVHRPRQNQASSSSSSSSV